MREFVRRFMRCASATRQPYHAVAVWRKFSRADFSNVSRQRVLLSHGQIMQESAASIRRNITLILPDVRSHIRVELSMLEPSNSSSDSLKSTEVKVWSDPDNVCESVPTWLLLIMRWTSAIHMVTEATTHLVAHCKREPFCRCRQLHTNFLLASTLCSGFPHRVRSIPWG